MDIYHSIHRPRLFRWRDYLATIVIILRMSYPSELIISISYTSLWDEIIEVYWIPRPANIFMILRFLRTHLNISSHSQTSQAEVRPLIYLNLPDGSTYLTIACRIVIFLWDILLICANFWHSVCPTATIFMSTNPRMLGLMAWLGSTTSHS